MVKYGRNTVRGQTLVAIDSGIDHDVAFNEAVSLQVLCDSQAELDRYWAALSEAGSPGPCGWLKDRDVAARDRAFKAIMGMR